MNTPQVTPLGDFLLVDGSFEDRHRDESVLVAPVFMQTFLPYEDPHVIDVRVKRGEFSTMLFSWMEPLPAGTWARWLLWTCCRVVHADAHPFDGPFVLDFGPFLEAAVTHPETNEMDADDLRWVRELYARVLDTNIVVGEERGTGSRRGYRHHHLKVSDRRCGEYDDFFRDSDEGDFTVTLSPNFVRAAALSPAPAGQEAMSVAGMDGGPLSMDMLSWLLFRAGTISADCCLSWENTHAQFGSHGDVASFARDFKDRLGGVSGLLPRVEVTADERGVTVSHR